MQSIRYGIAVALVVASLVPALGAGDGDARPAALRAIDAELQADRARFDVAMKALSETDEYKAAREAKDRDAINRLRATITRPARDAYAGRALDLAATLSGDDRARCLIWTFDTAESADLSTKALDKLFGEFVKSPVMLELCDLDGFQYRFARGDAATADARLTALASEGATPLIKAWGLFANAYRLGRNKDATEEDRNRAATMSAEAEKLAAGTDLADLIAAPRFEKERLQIGMVAPEIEGKGLDGKPMKLSNYLGKVVVLDFWGDW